MHSPSAVRKTESELFVCTGYSCPNKRVKSNQYSFHAYCTPRIQCIHLQLFTFTTYRRWRAAGRAMPPSPCLSGRRQAYVSSCSGQATPQGEAMRGGDEAVEGQSNAMRGGDGLSKARGAQGCARVCAQACAQCGAREAREAK